MSRDAMGDRAQALANGRRLLDRDPAAAARQARLMLTVDAQDADALRLLGRACRRLDLTDEAKQAERAAIRAGSLNPLLVEAANAIAARELAHAEQLLRPYVQGAPEDAAAHLMLGRIAVDVGALDQAVHWIGRALKLAPDYVEARLAQAQMLADRGALSDAVAALDVVLAEFPDHPRALTLKAAILGRLGDYDPALAIHERLLALDGRVARRWIAYGHALRTVGQREKAIAAYRSAIAIDPAGGEAWWSLANLKTRALDDADIRAMEAALAQPMLGEDDRLHLQFALGKAREDANDFERSFGHYAQGNRIRTTMLNHDPEAISAKVDQSIALFTAEYVTACIEGGDPSADPIFVLGMPRAGSTLLEQILASHSMIEGTSELPYIPALSPGPDAIGNLSASERPSLGETYLRSARAHRKTGRPFFIDKLPNNWLEIPFIHAILPNAKIIDMRRHPVGCCWANFKQHFAQGQAFSYSLDHLARYYQDYVRMLAHIDSVAPGRIHRLHYEHLVENTEEEIRRLLDFLGLPFEESCLRFYANDRAVRTPSSEQVRRPISSHAVNEWRNFEPWLSPLINTLGG